MESKKSPLQYFIGACYGALILVALMYILMAAGLAGNPGFVNTYHATFGQHIPLLDHLLAAILFVLSGGIWGLIFRFVPRPNPLKGMAFGLLPTLWLWVVVIPFAGGPMFGGFALKSILMPLLFNCIIWGSFVGWYVQQDN